MTLRLALASLLVVGCGGSPGADDGGARMDAGAGDAGAGDAGVDDAGVDDGGGNDDAGAGDDAGIDCSVIGCGAPVFCGEACAAPCGCCPCGDETFCADDDLVTCDGGCYERTACSPGTCAMSATGAACEGSGDTCAALEAMYEALVGPTSMRCGAPGECHILFGHCGVGLGGCHYALNTGVTQAQLDALATRWTAMGCDVGRPVCDCPVPPDMVRCDAGGCLAR